MNHQRVTWRVAGRDMSSFIDAALNEAEEARVLSFLVRMREEGRLDFHAIHHQSADLATETEVMRFLRRQCGVE